jgi:YgiT-type zinc finger domain-containing protein
MATKRETTELMDAVQREMQAWRSTHPRASLAEIEAAVEERINRIRTRLVEETIEDLPVLEQPICSTCGTTMVPRSQADRTLTLQGEQALDLRRSYAVCPTCGAGLFPPGRAAGDSA